MRRVTHAACHTLAGLCERWRYEAREAERRATLVERPGAQRAIAGVYRACADSLEEVMASYKAELGPEPEPPEGAA